MKVQEIHFIKIGKLYKLVTEDVKDYLIKRGIGTRINNDLYLDALEIAYLALHYRVYVDGKPVNAIEFTKNIDNFLKFTVYLDLRKRGYYVKVNIGDAPIDLLMWEKGKNPVNSNPKYGIKIVTEGLGIKVSDLLNVLKYCESMGIQLVLALVSNEGVITYYKAFTYRPIKSSV